VHPQPPAGAFPQISEIDLRRMAWRQAGLVRDAAGLSQMIHDLEAVPQVDLPDPERVDYEVRNIHPVALLIARCGLARQESRGGHYRTDYPSKRTQFEKHSTVSLSKPVEFE